MKKLTGSVIFVLFFISAHAQKINETEAQQFLERVWSYLKTSDSVAFINLWPVEDSAWQTMNAPAGINYMESFHRLKKFLSPAITSNLAIDHVVVGAENTQGTEITAMLKPREHAYLGFTFHVAFVNDKWIPRGKPNYLAKSK